MVSWTSCMVLFTMAPGDRRVGNEAILARVWSPRTCRSVVIPMLGRVTILLRLLDEVSYAGSPVAGARPADLLAALVLHPSGIADQRLVDEIWGDDLPAVPGKALQVLVSRLRTQLGAETLARADGGYRLALEPDAVDAWVLERLVTDAGRALA